jgi:hypothetical protein
MSLASLLFIVGLSAMQADWQATAAVAFMVSGACALRSGEIRRAV